MSTFTSYSIHQPQPAAGLQDFLRQVTVLFRRLDHPRVLRQLTERQRRDAGLPVELDGPYTEVFRNIGWN
ncbi:MAG: hypothetical protein JWO28_1893 [Hyphomicrobiales bacterium]|nr:hypothetical protein [Hyphomicrobiales bacterium]